MKWRKKLNQHKIMSQNKKDKIKKIVHKNNKQSKHHKIINLALLNKMKTNR